MTSITVINKKAEKVDSLKLNEKVFNGKPNKVLLHQALTMYLANQRSCSAKTKTRAEVRGGGRKPWRQKGTGRARAGSSRSPIWTGGGITFGPVPADRHYQLPRRMKRAALASSLNAKLNEEKVTVIDGIRLKSHKTKELLDILKRLKLDTVSLVIISDNPDENLKKAAGNIEKVDLVRAEDVTAYQVIVKDKVLAEKPALERIVKNLTKVA